MIQTKQTLLATPRFEPACKIQSAWEEGIAMAKKKKKPVPGAQLAHCSHGSITPHIRFRIEVAA